MSLSDPSSLKRSEPRGARRNGTDPLPAQAPAAAAEAPSSEPFRGTVRTLGAFDLVRAQLAELGAEPPASS